MRLAMIGLGKMGGNMTERLLRNGHQVVAFDRAADVVDKYAKLGATPAKDLAAVIHRCLEKNPNDRFRSFESLVDHLKK